MTWRWSSTEGEAASGRLGLCWRRAEGAGRLGLPGLPDRSDLVAWNPAADVDRNVAIAVLPQHRGG